MEIKSSRGTGFASFTVKDFSHHPGLWFPTFKSPDTHNLLRNLVRNKIPLDLFCPASDPTPFFPSPFPSFSPAFNLLSLFAWVFFFFFNWLLHETMLKLWLVSLEVRGLSVISVEFTNCTSDSHYSPVSCNNSNHPEPGPDMDSCGPLQACCLSDWPVSSGFFNPQKTWGRASLDQGLYSEQQHTFNWNEICRI